MIDNEFIIANKYRPTKVSECILPDRLKTVFQGFVDNKEIPNLLLTGTSGLGKTTVAMAMCDEIGLNHLFINSSKDRGIDVLRNRIVSYASTASMFHAGRKVIILDEADYITPEAQAALRGTMDEFSSNCTFILTCNYKSRLIDAIHSRCSVIDFTLSPEERPEMAKQFLERVKFILDTEGVSYKVPVLVEIVKRFFPDYRRTLNEIQKGMKTGAIDESLLARIGEVRNLGDLVKALKNKKFSDMRKWVVVNSDTDPARMFRRVYDSLYDFLKPESIPQAVIIIAKYQYQSAFVADQEINMVAFFTELMVDCEFKDLIDG